MNPHLIQAGEIAENNELRSQQSGFHSCHILILAQGLNFKTFVHHLPFRVLHFNRLSAEVVVSTSLYHTAAASESGSSDVWS